MNQRTVRNERIDLRKRLRRNARELQQACGITAEFFDNLRIQAQGLHTNHAVQRAGTATRFYLAHRSPPCGRSSSPLPQERVPDRSEEHTSELQSLMRISYAVF